MVGKFILGLMLCFASVVQAQDSLGVKLGGDYPLNERIGPIGEYTRPAIYDRWFAKIIKCEGLTMPPQDEIDRIQFFVTNSAAFSNPADTTNTLFDAVTFPQKHVIIISLPNVWDYDVVAHEFLHFALWYNFGPIYQGPLNSHPSKYFGHCNIRSH